MERPESRHALRKAASFFLYSPEGLTFILSRMSKTALGRGLGALLGGATAAKLSSTAPTTPIAPRPGKAPVAAPEPVPEGVHGVQRLKLAQIRPCPSQPRKHFTTESIEELALSIRENGLLQPLVVRPSGSGYELIAGERRWRACQQAGLSEALVIVREASDREVLELALVENLQRENLNPVEESAGFAQLLSQFELRQEDIATRVGKSRAHVANSLRLLRLPQDILAHLRDGRITSGHAKAILGLPSPEEQQLACDKVLREGLNVRDTEALVQRLSLGSTPSPGSTKRAKSSPSADANLLRVETRLQEKFRTRVRLRYRQGKGSIEIQFFSDDELERVLSLVGIHPE